ncbi:hypothetical protein Desca_1150 [Desulfotomaculum nigrificans CO-1-SRB]|uniref:Uncharacterized protein n=1 Tax=Desulfotomaculum nigrificans (strain DSM 14880 / VKM B-2319 / CO-1-SRB) TaxID=868595 RepID=F6B3I7_DESCC|nr:hypothetical protein Desca_1150 [Desulfotomaculum nigrificans CO-1-SRB]
MAPFIFQKTFLHNYKDLTWIRTMLSMLLIVFYHILYENNE